MAVVINGTTGITAPGVETFGNGTAVGGTTNPIVAMTGASTNYVQAYAVNNTNGTSSSADLVAYPSNGNDSHGWVDMGITSLAYADTTYTITGPNESYLFGSAPSGSSTTGNLVIATDNTGTANSIQFYTNGFTQAKSAAKMVIDGATGNVGIGTTSPSTYGKFAVVGADGYISASVGSTTALTQYISGDLAYLCAGPASGSNGKSIVFQTGSSGLGSERMRIDSSGNLLVGTTTSVGRLTVTANSTNAVVAYATNGNNAIGINNTSGTATYNGLVFSNNGGSSFVASVQVFASSVAYNTSSDARLKENVQDAQSAIDLVNTVKVRSFDWINTGEHQRFGMVAQELQEVFPEVVNNQMDENNTLGIDYSKLTPMLVKAIQEQQAILSSQAAVITQLQADVAALKGTQA